MKTAECQYPPKADINNDPASHFYHHLNLVTDSDKPLSPLADEFSRYFHHLNMMWYITPALPDVKVSIFVSS